MPRIVPIQLLKCLKVLLDDNGGILSAGEVKRLASLMTKYSKKLVSKCIYVQILKCTKTELLGEFMGAGGWSLVYTWLNDAIRAMNWPLVQEILELLLLCPVDVHRLKINSAPKLVKGLCKDGGNEGVRILAKRLVEQWLKVVTENPDATLPQTTNMPPQAATVLKTPTVAVVAPEAIPVNVQQQTAMVNSINQISSKQQQQQIQTSQKVPQKPVQDFEDEDEEEEEENVREDTQEDQDPLGGVQESLPESNKYSLTSAQKKANESGLVYKIIVKDGQSVLAKVPPKSSQAMAVNQPTAEDENEVAKGGDVEEEEAEEADATDVDRSDNAAIVVEVDENSSSLDKTEKENDSNSGAEDETKLKTKTEESRKSEDKKTTEDKDKSSSQKERRSSKETERRVSSSGSLDKDRDNKSSKSSSSSSHRSSSHKSSSSSSKSSSSSSSKSKSSSSSSSSYRSSSDKHKSDKDRSSSSKDKDRSSSSSSSKHRSSSSSKSSSSSSSSKDKYREKEKDKSSSSSSSKSKDKETSNADKEKVISSTSSLDKLGKIPKKLKEDDAEASSKHTSITIPSKKASMSIEIRKDTEKSKTVKTYKSQFRSHGLTEEAPPPPSRKGLKKPASTTPSPGTILPSSLPSSLKRTSPPPRDSPTEKKMKIDINVIPVTNNEKPGSIKLIPAKKIQTLVETNLFSDALSAATGPKKLNKRKRPTMVNGKEVPSSPTSPEAPKVMPLKFYQDTLDESKSDKENDEGSSSAGTTKASDDDNSADKENDDDDDIPLKKVKEDIELKVAQEKKMEGDANTIDITKDDDDEKEKQNSEGSPSTQQQQSDSPKDDDNDVEMSEVKKPGPGCGPNGPPGVLMLHRRKGPKKKLTWRPHETLEQIRYFELDENERCNVTKTSFMDMKNLERFNERDAIVMARRGFNHEDNMEPQTHWRGLVELDDVPTHPEGNQSKQRKIQAERELTTLRALYFTHALIPDSPAEAEIEPVYNHDVPLIPLEDLTGNPDAVNDFTSMPWPEPRGSPKQGDNSMAGTGGLGSPVDMFGGGGPPPQKTSVVSHMKGGGGNGDNVNPFNPFVPPFVGVQVPNGPVNVPVNGPPMQNSPQGQWQGPPNGMGPMVNNGPMMGNPFNGNHGSPIMDMGGPGPMGPVPMMNNGPQNFMNQFSPPFGGPPNNPFSGAPPGFNNGPNNFGPMGPGGPMGPVGPIMNGMVPNHMMGNNGPSMMNGPNNRNNNNNNNNKRGNNNGGNWRTGNSNFQDNMGGNGGNGGGNWRPAGPGPNRGNGGGNNNNNNNGICKAFMRGHCRVGKSCKYIHPNKNKRI